MTEGPAVPHLASTARARLATRLAFFASGFAAASWAPLIPFAKTRVGADEATLGLLLLCLGLGSVVAMPVTGWVAARRGARPMILLGGITMGVVLPALMLADSVGLLAVALVLFGAGLGTLDVSMNVHGAEIEAREGRPLMSGFHAQFSIGGFSGAAAMTGLLVLGLGAASAALAGGLLTLGVIALAAPRLLRARGGDPEPFALPRGIVILLAVLAGVLFLVEGAILDWGALLIIDRGLADTRGGGVGYILFSVAMVIGRLTGDRVVAALGGFRILFAGGLVTIAGLATILIAGPGIAMFGFVLVGLGAANMVPVLFSAAGRQTVMPAGLAIAAVTTTGYAGVLLGPALVGLAAQQTSLPSAFWLLVLLLLLVPLSARRVARLD